MEVLTLSRPESSAKQHRHEGLQLSECFRKETTEFNFSETISQRKHANCSLNMRQTGRPVTTFINTLTLKIILNDIETLSFPGIYNLFQCFKKHSLIGALRICFKKMPT